MKKRLRRLPAVSAIGGIWPFLKPEGRLVLYAVSLTLCLTAVEVAAPVLLGVFLDSLLAGPGGEEPALISALGRQGVVAMLLSGALLAGLLLAHQAALSGKIGQRVSARMRDALWEHLQKLPLEYTRQRGPGRLLVRFLSDARAVQKLVSEGVVRITQDMVLVGAVVTVLLFINWRMGLVVVLALPIYALIFRRLNCEIQRQSRATRRRRTRLSSYLGDRLAVMEVVKAHGRQRAETRKVEKLNRRVAERGARLASAGGWLEGASAAVIATTSALVLGVASAEISAMRLTGGQLVTFYTLIGLLAPVFQRITVANRYLQEAQISIERLTDTLAQEPESPPGEELPKLRVEEGSVSLEDVSFSYPDGTAVLKGVNLTARRGELVALVGPNGSGKSSLLKLLPRFLKPAAGRILVDGQDTAEVSVRSLRSRIGLVEQDVKVFEGTISENVAYGVRGNTPKEQVERATRLAGVDALVETLPDGWETKLREGRRELSQAERQRVALARVLAVDPPILALDETGSAMDPRAEQDLAQTLRALAHEKTVLIATRSLPVMLLADRIYRLEHGRVLQEDLSTLFMRRGETRPG